MAATNFQPPAALKETIVKFIVSVGKARIQEDSLAIHDKIAHSPIRHGIPALGRFVIPVIPTSIAIDMHEGFPVESRARDHAIKSVSYTHLRAHETDSYLVCRLLLEKKKKK